MRIIVLIKQVPDMEKVKFDREKGVVDRKSAGTEPYKSKNKTAPKS